MKRGRILFSGGLCFLVAGDKRVVDTDAEKSKLFATSEEWHEM